MSGRHPSAGRSLLFFVESSHQNHLVLASILPVGTAVVEVALAWILGRFFDAFSQAASTKTDGADIATTIYFYVWCLLGLVFLTLMLNGIYFASWLYFGDRQVDSARRRLFPSLLGHNVAWFEAQEEGVDALMLQTQTHLLHFGLSASQSLGMALHSFVSAVIATSLGLYLMWDVTLVVLSPLPLTLMGMVYLSERISAVLATRNAGMCRASRTVSNAIRAIDIVHCHNGQNAETRKYELALRLAAEAHAKYALLSALQIAIARFVTLAMLFLGLWYGVRAIYTGQRTPGELLITFWACLIATQAIERLSTLIPTLVKGNVSAEFLRNLSSCSDRFVPVSSRSLNATGRLKGGISIENVSFSYDHLGTERALEKVSLRLPAKKMTFVIGTSGSGKTTLASLLAGIYHPTEGSILVDDTPINHYDTEQLRDRVTFICQTAEIFRASVLENILISKPMAKKPSSVDVNDCLEFSGLADVVHQLPRGIHTSLGRDGTILSGGQQQRISLSRAKLRDTPILILDEATSALDPKSRDILMQKLRRWRDGKTTIFITHDYCHIQDDDHVCYLENGHVVEEGTWKQLSRNLSITRSSMSWTQKRQEKRSPQIETAHTQTLLQLSIPAGPRLSIASGMLVPFSPVLPSPMSESNLLATASLLSSSFLTGAESGHLAGSEGVPDQTFTPESVHRPTMAHISRTIWPALDQSGRFQLIVGICCALMHALATPVFAYAFARVLQTLTLPPEEILQYARGWILTIAGLAIFDSTFAFLMHRCFESTSLKWIDDIRLRSVKRILRQPRACFDTAANSAEHVDSCLDKSAEEMRSLLSSFVPLMLVSCCMVSVAISWSVILCWRLALMGLIVALPMFFLSQSFQRASQAWDAQSHKASIAAAEILMEACTNIRTVHAFNLKTKIHRQYLRRTRKALRIGRKRAWKSGLFVGTIDALMVLSQALIFWYGFKLIRNYDVSVNTAVTVFSLLLFSISGAGALVSSIPQVSAGQAAAARLLTLLERSQIDLNTQSLIHVSSIPAPIGFTNFGLVYPSRPSDYALRFLDMEISRGSSVGLIGASGSGKTTVLKALLGLYPSSSSERLDTEGSLMLGPHPFAAYHLPTLRSHMGYVPQDVQLFPDTIAQNILYGKDSDSSPSNFLPVREAALLAGIDDFVLSLPNGYETSIGEGGLGLSLGQTQRIGIARAIARQPGLLIMDEPTSNLDAGAAAHIRETIKTLVQQGTTVVVATHSTDMMMTCDRLVLLDAGHAIEEGAWTELMGREHSHLRHLLESQQST